MKILLVNKFHYNKGGSETFYFSLDEIMRAHGHQVIHFAMEDEKNFESPTSEFFVSNVDYNANGGIGSKIRVVKNIFYSREAYQKMKKLLEREHPDVVHLGLVHKQITYSIIDAIKEYNIPIVQNVHDLIFICPCCTMLVNGENCRLCVNGSVWNCVRKKCVKGSLAKSAMAVLENKYLAYKKYYDKVDAFITECKFYKEILEESEFTKSRIVNISNFLPPSKEMRMLKNNGGYFLFFGRFSPEKGIMTLLEAYRIANLSTPLVLVGGGPLNEAVKEYIYNNGLADKVTLTGYVYGNEMEKMLEAAKAVIVPSEWYENCPYSILESMGKSRIVIASRIAGLPELVQDGVSGYLFEPHNAEQLALKMRIVENLGPAAYEEMCTNTYLRAEEMFSPEKYYTQIMGLYSELIKKGNKNGN